jgi:hypothetical protein
MRIWCGKATRPSGGDIETLRRNFFAEDVRYHVPGKSPLGGDYEGVAQRTC